MSSGLADRADMPWNPERTERVWGELIPAQGAPWMPGLKAAFSQGYDRIELSFLGDILDPVLRDGMRMLSPHEAGGLGTFDHLTTINQIDELYLFLAQTRFYKGWGELLLLPS
jgi:hypothetical protein